MAKEHFLEFHENIAFFFQIFSPKRHFFSKYSSDHAEKALTLSHQKISVRFPLEFFLRTLDLRLQQQKTLPGVIPSDL